MKQVFIRKQWYNILEQNGNYALIQFDNGKFCYNILGLETRNIEEKVSQQTLF